MPKKKRYFFSVVEEMIMNEKAERFCAGRIEVYDSKDDRDYACYEARFLIPREFMDDFRKPWDYRESDKMPYIQWDCGITGNNVRGCRNDGRKLLK